MRKYGTNNLFLRIFLVVRNKIDKVGLGKQGELRQKGQFYQFWSHEHYYKKYNRLEKKVFKIDMSYIFW